MRSVPLEELQRLAYEWLGEAKRQRAAMDDLGQNDEEYWLHKEVAETYEACATTWASC